MNYGVVAIGSSMIMNVPRCLPKASLTCPVLRSMYRLSSPTSWRFGLTSLAAGEFVERHHEKGLRMLPSGNNGVRAIPYLNISTLQVMETSISFHRSRRRMQPGRVLRGRSTTEY
jgi:hypothetical protein